MRTESEKELLEFETRFWNAMKEKDVETAMHLTDETCILAGAQGVSQIDKHAFGKMMEAEGWTLHNFTLADVKIQRLSDEVAVIGYKVHEELTVDGKPVAFDAADASTWVRRDGRWVCAMHTESIFGDPFGRDRTGATVS